MLGKISLSLLLIVAWAWPLIATEPTVSRIEATAGEPIAEGVAPPAENPVDQVLLLNNGRIVQGPCYRDGQRYIVRIADGEIRLRASDVRAVYNSLEEVYDCLAKECGDSIDKHLQLAVWCVEKGLIGRAAGQLAEATAIDPNDRRLDFVERRIRNANPRLGPGKTTPIAEVAKPTDELLRLVRSLPRGATERFTTVVQPVLINRCATGGCHGPGCQNGFQLQRPPASRVQSRPVTQHNLQTVLAYVDQNQPNQSRLIGAVLEPHGGRDALLAGERDAAQREQLVRWVASLGKTSPKPLPTSVAQPFPALGQADAPVSRASHVVGGPPLQRTTAASRNPSRLQPVRQQPKLIQPPKSGVTEFEDDPLDAADMPDALLGDDDLNMTPSGNPDPTTVIEEPGSVNDPEIFNRRYSTQP